MFLWKETPSPAVNLAVSSISSLAFSSLSQNHIGCVPRWQWVFSDLQFSRSHDDFCQQVILTVTHSLVCHCLSVRVANLDLWKKGTVDQMSGVGGGHFYQFRLTTQHEDRHTVILINQFVVLTQLEKHVSENLSPWIGRTHSNSESLAQSGLWIAYLFLRAGGLHVFAPSPSSSVISLTFQMETLKLLWALDGSACMMHLIMRLDVWCRQRP